MNPMNIGTIVKLRKLNRRGLNLLDRFGSEWIVLAVRNRVNFCSDPGPWTLLWSLSGKDELLWLGPSGEDVVPEPLPEV